MTTSETKTGSAKTGSGKTGSGKTGSEKSGAAKSGAAKKPSVAKTSVAKNSVAKTGVAEKAHAPASAVTARPDTALTDAALSNIARATTGPTDTVTPEATTVAEVKAPDRPPLTGKEAAPVLVKLPPPFFVRLSQISWLLSLLAGGVAVVYLFIIRQAQLPEIADLVRAVDGSRAEATYTTAADIVFWSVFTPIVAIILAQIAMQVSFANRRPNVRWWQFATVLFQAGVFLIARELVVFGDRGLPLDRILLIQLGLAALGLLISLLPPALRWTARRHDIRRGEPVAPASDGQL